MTRPRGRFDGKVTIVTGSGKGIGRAQAMLLASEGAQVVVNDIGRAADGGLHADAVVAEITAAGGAAVAATHSVSTFAGCAAVVTTALRAFGRLDIVVNNAGLRAMNRIDLLTEADFDNVVSSHLKASFAMTKYSVPLLVSQGGGVILNTGSEAGLGMPFNTAYAAAKEGIAGLTRSVAREFGGLGVRCNQIRPRATTARSGEVDDSVRRSSSLRAKLGRYSLGQRGDIPTISTAGDVAVLSAWLCSDAAADINGYDFFVSGGEIGLWSEPELGRTVFKADGWTLDDLDHFAPSSLTRGLENRFTAISEF